MLHLCQRRILPVVGAALMSLLWIQVCLGQAQPRQLPIKGEFTAPQWSPDGKWIALAVHGHKGICVVKPDGSGLKQITDEPGAGFRFAWSPDSRQIAYKARNVGGQPEMSAVKVAAIDGSGIKTIVESKGDVGQPCWAGKDSLRYVADAKLTVASLVTGAAQAKASCNAAVAVDAADGKAVVADATEQDRVVLISADGQKSYLTQEKDGRFYDPQVSPQGDRVLVHNLADGHIYVLNLVDGARTDLGEGYAGRWSPEGKRIVCNTSEDDGHQITQADIVVIDVAGRSRTAVTKTTDRCEMYPAWSPDGGKIAYGDHKTGAIFVQTVAGGAQ